MGSRIWIPDAGLSDSGDHRVRSTVSLGFTLNLDKWGLVRWDPRADVSDAGDPGAEQDPLSDPVSGLT
jgi:hypothetical protein